MVDFGALFIVTQHLIVTMMDERFFHLINTGTWTKLDLEEISRMVSTLSNVLHRQAEVQQEISDEERQWFKKLSDAVYEADDLAYKLHTRAYTRRTIDEKLGLRSRKIQREYADLLPRFDQVLTTLVGVATDRFGFEPTMETRESTSNILDLRNVVGRKDDLNEVVDQLLQSPIDSNRCRFLAIVGSGGKGKTTLAQLLYDDARVKNAFTSRRWVNASERKFIIDGSSTPKALVVFDGERSRSNLYWDIAGVRQYSNQSALVVSTRSEYMARLMERLLYDDNEKPYRTYKLKGLSEESSWQLFEMAAFGEVKNQIHPSEYAQMAEKIAEICFDLPAAIKMVGNLLNGQEQSKWTWFLELEPAMIRQSTEVMSILRLTYDYLHPPLKCCFSYCALFPQDFVIDKWMLISLWMAQDYIEPSLYGGNDYHSLINVGEIYFCALLQNGFFEVVERDANGGVISCKINKWMYHVAQYIAREEICFTHSSNNQFGDRIYHVFHTGEHYVETFPNEATIRSYHRDGVSPVSLDTIVRQWTSLRVLGLHNSDIKSLPDSICQMSLLRYLNLSHNRNLEELPSSIVKLYNLQTLDLRFCSLLKELPQELHKLSKLICLDIFGCDGLEYMPPNLDELTCLEILSNFVVGESKSSEKQHHGQVKDLVKLTKLKGRLCINIPSTHTYVKRMESQREDLSALRHLDELWIRYLGSHPADDSDVRVRNYHQDLLKRLRPSEYIQGLMIWGYQGTIMPWGSEYEISFELRDLIRFELRSSENLQQLVLLCPSNSLKSLKLYGLMNLIFLQNISCKLAEQLGNGFFISLEEFELVNAPKLRRFIDDVIFPPRAFESLVRIEIRSCQKLQQLPFLSELSHLVSVKLCGLSNLEFLENRPNSDTEAQSIFFPCLESLEVTNAAKLRGLCLGVAWSGLADDSITDKSSPPTSCFPRLKYLKLGNLPELRGFFFAKNGDAFEQLDHLYVPQFGRLKELKVSSCPQLNSMPTMPSLESLNAGHVQKELLNHLLQTQGSPSSSTTPRIRKLRNVNIVSVNDLECLSLSTLDVESLTIRRCQYLSNLTLRSPPSVKKLSIHECGELKHISSPWQQLTSLEELEIEGCQILDWEIKDAEDEANNISSTAAWQSLCNLRSLTLTNISNFQSVSRGMGCIPNLEQLHLSWLLDLRALPETIGLLPKLRHLTVSHCPNLTAFPESLYTLSTLKMLVLEHCWQLRIPVDLSAKLEIRISPNLQD